MWLKQARRPQALDFKAGRDFSGDGFAKWIGMAGLEFAK
jgi:hypothetical protein